MQKLLTISIAAYNQEKYIEQAIDSLIDIRTIDELEIFIVDDGGQDKTLEIAQKYAQNYPKSIFPVHKENGGYGTTINYSIGHMSGKYFRMLDGDDWYDKKGFYEFIVELRKTDADVVITPYYEGSRKDEMRQVHWNMPWGKRINIDSMGGKQTFGMWAITYRADVIKKSGMWLPPTLYVDQVYNIVPFTYAVTIKFIKNGVYCYRTGQDGQSISRAARIRNTQDILDLCILQCRFYEDQKQVKGNNLNYVASRIGGDAYQFSFNTLIMHPISKENLNRLIEFDKRVKQLSLDVYYKAQEVGRWHLLVALFRMTHYQIYWVMRLLPDGFLHKLWLIYKKYCERRRISSFKVRTEV